MREHGDCPLKVSRVDRSQLSVKGVSLQRMRPMTLLVIAGSPPRYSLGSRCRFPLLRTHGSRGSAQTPGCWPRSWLGQSGLSHSMKRPAINFWHCALAWRLAGLTRRSVLAAGWDPDLFHDQVSITAEGVGTWALVPETMRETGRTIRPNWR